MNSLRKYRYIVSKKLVCNRGTRNELLEQLDKWLADLTKSKPTPDMGYLWKVLGSPQEITAVLMKDVPDREIKQYKKHKRGTIFRRILILPIIVALIPLYFWLISSFDALYSYWDNVSMTAKSFSTLKEMDDVYDNKLPFGAKIIYAEESVPFHDSVKSVDVYLAVSSEYTNSLISFLEDRDLSKHTDEEYAYLSAIVKKQRKNTTIIDVNYTFHENYYTFEIVINPSYKHYLIAFSVIYFCLSLAILVLMWIPYEKIK